MEVCLEHKSIDNGKECQNATVGTELILFRLNSLNINIRYNDPFTFTIRNLTNPKNETHCK
jgi:hypothetical protein